MARLAMIILVIFSGALHSEERFVPKAKMHPLFGCFITDIYDFEYQNNKFSVGGYLWTRHKEKGYKPESSIEVVNSEEYTGKESYIYGRDGLIYFGQKFNANAFHQWDMTKFPFDRQILHIHFEDSWYDVTELEFKADQENSGKASDISIAGWTILDYTISSKVYNYDSNFGEMGRTETGFSRVTASIIIKRNWVRPFINYFSTFFLSFLLSILALLISPSELSTKFSLTLASVFAVVGNNYILDQIVPITSEFTLSDKIEVATFLFIVVTVIFNSYEIHLLARRGIKIRKKILLFLVPSTVLSYLAYVGYSIYLACVS